MLGNPTNRKKIAEILGSDNINKLSDKNLSNLLFYSIDRDTIAEIIGSDNINKLSEKNVRDLLSFVTGRKQMAQIINKYHTKKTPEIQELIDKYI